MLQKVILYVFISCFLHVGSVCAQSPKTDTIPSLPPESEAKIDRDTTSWLNDTTNQKKKHSPRKATLYSTILPGLGQVYNRQYYKVPIIAVIGILLATQISSNQYDLIQADRNLETRLRNELRPNYNIAGSFDYTEYDAYDAKKPSNFLGSGNRTYTTDQLRLIRNGYRRDRDFYIILSALTYALNIVDAAVFAHLREFEINDKLSLKIQPDLKFLPGTSIPATGLCLSFDFLNKK